MQKRIRIAIQKKGRLHDDTIDLLKKADFSISSSNRYLLKVNNFPLDIILVRDDDVPYVVAAAACHWGIVGKDTCEETCLADENVKRSIEQSALLDFGTCRLSIAVPENMIYKSIKDLHQKRIATSYPELLKQFLNQQGIQSTIIPMHGSVEVAPKIEVADAICDIVSSGATLQENKLVEKDVILRSKAVIIRNLSLIEESKDLYQEFTTRIHSVQIAREKRYVMMNIPKAQLSHILNIFPKTCSPTILNLQDENMLAVHVLLDNKNIWDILHQLEKSQASSILVVPVEKMLL